MLRLGLRQRKADERVEFVECVECVENAKLEYKARWTTLTLEHLLKVIVAR